jgi:hypothetical protein
MKRSPIRKKRSKPRRGQTTPEEMAAIRKAVYERSGGRCELRLSEDCITGVLAWDGGSSWSHGHLVHLKARRRFGTTLEDSRWGCWHCHLVGLHNPKPCPAKPKMDAE